MKAFPEEAEKIVRLTEKLMPPASPASYTCVHEHIKYNIQFLFKVKLLYFKHIALFNTNLYQLNTFHRYSPKCRDSVMRENDVSGTNILEIQAKTNIHRPKRDIR